MTRATVAALVPFAAALAILSRRPEASSIRPIDANSTPATLSSGPADAPHRLVVYSDYQCPACALLHREAEPSLLELAESGRLRLELRHFPLPGHRRASRAAVVSVCAGQQGAGWKMHDALFRTATLWTSPAPSAPWFQHLADSLGLDERALDLCIKDASVVGHLAADLALGRAAGLIGVPAFFLDGHPVTLRSPRGLVRRVKRITRDGVPPRSESIPPHSVPERVP